MRDLRGHLSGIYVPPTANFPKHFHNMGIRIEDEVLVGKEHPVVLSVSAPKEVRSSAMGIYVFAYEIVISDCGCRRGMSRHTWP
jgi:hypothetical protein